MIKEIKMIEADTAIKIMNKEIKVSEINEHNQEIKAEIKRVKGIKAQQVKIDYGYHMTKKQCLWNLECRIEENDRLIQAIRNNIDKLMIEADNETEAPQNFDPLAILMGK